MCPIQNWESERAHLIEVAQRWRGTPYHDRSDKRGIGCDCAGLPKGACVEAGLIEDFKLPYWDPQQWLRRDYEDTQYLNVLLRFCFEIREQDVMPADFVLYRVANSYTHGGIIIKWPEYVLHSIKDRGVIGSHGTNEGFLRGRKRRFFRLRRWG
jgi:cell wall-associated NlpC family hydrolase